MKTMRFTQVATFGDRAATIGRRMLIAEAPIHDAFDRLSPEERVGIAGATPARTREYSTGRALARELLIELGERQPKVARSPDRCPVWPAGYVGSIAHTERLCVVAVGSAADVLSVGIDVEPALALERDVLESIATPRELGALCWTSPGERGLDARRLFVAKEAVYKCLYPVCRTFLEFHDVEITFDAEFRRFRARCERAGAITRRLEGFTATRDDAFFALAVVPARASVEAS